VLALEVYPQVSVFAFKGSGSSAQEMTAICQIIASYGSPVVLRGACHQQFHSSGTLGQQVLMLYLTGQAVLVAGSSSEIAVNDALDFGVNFGSNDMRHTACDIV
jgi:glycerol uptake facilitator-like aquaporin